MSRSHENAIEIDAPVEDVWKALADPEELTRWFVVEARVDPRVGGEYWVSWGEGADGGSTIDVWEPHRRLKASFDPGTGPIAQDWLLETRGGSTLLRLVTSGMPDSSDWDGWYESTDLGWRLFLRNLRHYLEVHPGEPRQQRYVLESVAAAPDVVWAAVQSALGLDGALAERYDATTSDGDRLAGEVLLHVPGRALQLTLEPLDDGLLTLALETSSAWATVATFGEAESQAADRVAALLRRAFSTPV